MGGYHPPQSKVDLPNFGKGIGSYSIQEFFPSPGQICVGGVGFTS
jgi:hypothetical protein